MHGDAFYFFNEILKGADCMSGPVEMESDTTQRESWNQCMLSFIMYNENKGLDEILNCDWHLFYTDTRPILLNI